MKVGNNSSLASISASSTVRKEFELHTVYSGILEQIKQLQLIGQAAKFKFESKFKHLPIDSEGYSRRQKKVLTAQSIAELLGQCSGTAGAVLAAEHRHSVFSSGLLSPLAAASTLEDKATTLVLMT